MMRFGFTVIALILGLGAARADYVTLDLPATYTPGTPFTVGVGLEPINGLALYNVEVVFRASSPVLNQLSAGSPLPANSQYVFPSTANYFANVTPQGNELRIVLSDFVNTGVTVSPSVNDRLSRFTVEPATTFSGGIDVFVDRSSLFLDDPSGLSLIGAGNLPTGRIQQNQNNPIPAPPGVVGLAVVLALGAARSVWRRIA